MGIFRAASSLSGLDSRIQFIWFHHLTIKRPTLQSLKRHQQPLSQFLSHRLCTHSRYHGLRLPLHGPVIHRQLGPEMPVQSPILYRDLVLLQVFILTFLSLPLLLEHPLHLLFLILQIINMGPSGFIELGLKLAVLPLLFIKLLEHNTRCLEVIQLLRILQLCQVISMQS